MNKQSNKRVTFRLKDEDLEKKFNAMCFFLSMTGQEVFEMCIEAGFKESIANNPKLIKSAKEFWNSLDEK